MNPLFSIFTLSVLTYLGLLLSIPAYSSQPKKLKKTIPSLTFTQAAPDPDLDEELDLSTEGDFDPDSPSTEEKRSDSPPPWSANPIR